MHSAVRPPFVEFPMDGQHPDADILPVKTIVRVLIAIAAVWLILELHHVILLVATAFLAAALAPPVHRLEERGWPLPAVLAAVVSVIACIIAACM